MKNFLAGAINAAANDPDPAQIRSMQVRNVLIYQYKSLLKERFASGTTKEGTADENEIRAALRALSMTNADIIAIQTEVYKGTETK